MQMAGWQTAHPGSVSLVSLRAAGYHYALLPTDLYTGTHPPLVTVQWFDGARAVTRHLRYQGKVPKSFLAALPDNCVIVYGNPDGLPEGYHEP
jgi:hypothetical protein